MLKYNPLLIACFLFFFISFPVKADIKQYIRDYTYEADDIDTKYTCRVRAIDGVKQKLLEELGTYVQSIISVHESGSGEKYIEHDYVTLTAGIISVDILKEGWNHHAYYVQARLQADPDEVRHTLNALRKDIKLEQALRESMQNLAEARDTIATLLQEMQSQTDEAVLGKLNREYITATQRLEVEYQYQHAIKYIIDGYFEKAYQLLKDLAENNYASAQSKLGHMYERGMGLEVNYDQAGQWYLRAIKNGSATALARLGFLYERGLGVRQDFDMAIELYQQAVDKGNHQGQSRLALLYLKGKGVKKDTAKALKLGRASIASNKHGRGYTLLGYMYEKGIEVDKSYKQAATFYDKGARRGNPSGMARLAWLYAKGRGVALNYEKAWALSKHAEQYNNPFAMMVMGYMYEKGLGVDYNNKKAVELYYESAEQNSAVGMYRLGKAYENGRGVEEDIDEAVVWFRRAAELGHERASERLAEYE